VLQWGRKGKVGCSQKLKKKKEVSDEGGNGRERVIAKKKPQKGGKRFG